MSTYFGPSRRGLLCNGCDCPLTMEEHNYACPMPSTYGEHEIVEDSRHGWACKFCHETRDSVSRTGITCHDITGNLVHPDMTVPGEGCKWFTADGTHRLRFDGYVASFRSYVYVCPCDRRILSVGVAVVQS